MIDIALGLFSDGRDADLAAFARQHNASYMSQWREMGLFDRDVRGWARAFEQVMARTLARGGKIHFNLAGLNIEEALDGDPAEWVGRYTAWELQQIIRNASWFNDTIFYLGGEVLQTSQLSALGIEVVS